MFRQHQQQFLQTCALMKASTQLRKVIAYIVPGGGKSALPVIAASELIPFISDGLCWVTPRTNLRDQAETAFTAGWSRSLLGHKNEIRSATNETDLLRDKIGYATTYQALVISRNWQANPHTRLFERRRMILFLDEPNHAADGDEYAAALQPLVERAAAVFIMGGALSRHDNRRVAFLDYLGRDKSGKYFLDLNPSQTQTVIRYGLSDATREHAIININFELRDCTAAWDIIDDDGCVVSDGKLGSFDGASSKETSLGLYSALKTEFAKKLLREAADFWRDRRKHNSRSQFIVVCARIEDAQAALSILKDIGINADIATSDETRTALLNIDRFRRGQLNAIVTVAMAHEGMDVPAADVLVCLTHIRSREWIEQMIHRVTRFDPKNVLPWEQQFATIFAPKDRFFRDIMAEIKAEQAPFVRDVNAGPSSPPKSNDKLRARESDMTEGMAATFTDLPIEGDRHRQINDALRLADIHGAISTTAAQKFFDAMSQHPQSSTQSQQENVNNQQADVEPPSKREKKLRDMIVAAQREGYKPYDPLTRERVDRRGQAMWKMFRKHLKELTEAELQAVWDNRATWMVP